MSHTVQPMRIRAKDHRVDARSADLKRSLGGKNGDWKETMFFERTHTHTQTHTYIHTYTHTSCPAPFLQGFPVLCVTFHAEPHEIPDFLSGHLSEKTCTWICSNF